MQKLIEAEPVSEEIRLDQIPSITRALILKFVANHCFEFDQKVGAIAQKNPASVIEIFRYPMVTYLTSITFSSLKKGLNEGIKLLAKEKDQIEIYELHAFLNVLQLTLANIKAMNFCNISLSSILS